MSVFIPITQPASPASITNIESVFGARLPESYRLFLKDHDGAKPEENVFNIGKGNNAGVDQFIPASEIISVHDAVEGLPPNALPIARATAGNFVYLDPASGIVYFWDHENDTGDLKLADSFETFLALLKRFDVDQIKLKPGQVTKVWVNPRFTPKF